jgi:hypothetical protein
VRNEAKTEYRTTGVPMQDPVGALARLGYEDFRTRRPYRKDYEGWDAPRQRTYESGRRVAAALSKHVKLPPWPEDREFASLFVDVSDAAVKAFLAEDAFTQNRRAT